MGGFSKLDIVDKERFFGEVGKVFNGCLGFSSGQVQLLLESEDTWDHGEELVGKELLFKHVTVETEADGLEDGSVTFEEKIGLLGINFLHAGLQKVSVG